MIFIAWLTILSKFLGLYSKLTYNCKREKTFEEYVDALPQGSVMPKNVLEKIIERRKENQAKLTQMQMEADRLNSAMNQAMVIQEQNGNAVEDIAMQGESINANAINAMGAGKKAAKAINEYLKI